LSRLYRSFIVSSLCFTLIHSYRRPDLLDEALLFSLDFPEGLRAKDCYKLISERASFKLEGDKKRIFTGRGGKSNIALAVAPHGTHDDIVVVAIDGEFSNRISAKSVRSNFLPFPGPT
jgi:hypothetical protein